MIGNMEPGGTGVLTNRISRLMGERRLNIRDVANGAGISYRAAWELFHDRSKRLDVATLSRLCDYFGVGPGELFEWTPPAQTADQGEA